MTLAAKVGFPFLRWKISFQRADVGRLFVVFVLLFLSGCDAPASTKSYQAKGQIFGTTWSVKWHEKANHPSISKFDIQRKLEDLDAIFSTWRSDSEISKFNQIHQKWTPVSSEFFYVLQAASSAYELTEGAFDPTVGRSVNRWGFGPDEKLNMPMNGVNQHFSFSDIKFDPDQKRIFKPEGVAIDLSAIAKGYAVDEVSSLLSTNKIHDFMVEIGGEVRVKGVKSSGDRWAIGLEKPDPEARELYRILYLSDSSLATSGSYRNFRRVNGKTLSHIIDPETGDPVENDVVSLSVLAETCAMADALATGLMAQGSAKALALAEQHNLAIWVISKRENSFVNEHSSAFEEITVKEVSR